MSRYVRCDFEVADGAALVDALVELGFSRDVIEIHDNSTQLYGYRDDPRPERAHIVIRRANVGSASNDVGWERGADGVYRAWISDFDMRGRFDEATRNRLRVEYGVARLSREQRARGREVQRTRMPDGRVALTIRGVR